MLKIYIHIIQIAKANSIQLLHLPTSCLTVHLPSWQHAFFHPPTAPEKIQKRNSFQEIAIIFWSKTNQAKYFNEAEGKI